MDECLIIESLPVLALRGLTVFPRMTVHFDVGRAKSVKALEQAMAKDQRIFLVTQMDVLVDDPKEEDLFSIGTICHVKQVLKMPNDAIRILVEGECRGSLEALSSTQPFLFGRIMRLDESTDGSAQTPRLTALLRQGRALFEEFLELTQKPLQEQMMELIATQNAGFMADMIAQHGTFDYQDKQKILSTMNPARRLEIAVKCLARELEVLRYEASLQDKVQESLDKDQRNYYLREQMKVIRSELGEGDDDGELDHYRERIRKLGAGQEVEEKLLREVSRLAKQPFGSAEASVIRNYLDVALELPWNYKTRETVSVEKARKVLDQDHFGLEKVKQRILEVLAVRQLAPELPPPILCLVGPPGVGKTSIAMSIASALHRKLARISLGGVHDEAEIRGHRKTYIGAMPGRILTAIGQAGSKNPLLLLDEIDKLGADYRGDPSSALLEVLDAEQNASFRDNFLELPFDLSDCMFITTANTTETIPRALYDRMEVIPLSSYTDEEKLQIAKMHLLPKQLKKHGMTKTMLRVDDNAMRELIAGYTRESGVRNLERCLGTMCRKAAIQFVSENPPKRLHVTTSNLETFLGTRKFVPEKLPPEDPVGLVTGLAWTQVGGETLEVECNVMDGSGKLELTGNLGNVMKESVQAAMSYIRSRSAALHVPQDFYKTRDIHVHFPEGAIPKDGPSAGIAICTAMVSALSGATVRREIAMTGEISIRGRVLPIGGLKEKTMAALRHGIKTVIIPQDNAKDLEEIDQTVRHCLNFITVEHMDAVLTAALDFSVCKKPEQPAKPQSLPVMEQKQKERTPQIRQ